MPAIAIPTGSTSGPDQVSVRPSASAPRTIASGPVRSAVGVAGGRADPGRHDPDAAIAKPGQDIAGRRGRQGHREDRAGAGPDRVGVEQVRAGRRRDDRTHPGAVGGPQDGPDVPGLLDPFDDEDQRVVAGIQVGERPCRHPHDEDDPLRTAAERELREHGLADGRDRESREPVMRSSAARASSPPSRGSQTNASVDVHPGLERPAHLTGPVDDRQARRVPFAADRGGRPPPDARVRLARDQRVRGSSSVHHARPAARANQPSSRRRPSAVSRPRSPISTAEKGRRIPRTSAVRRSSASSVGVWAVSSTNPPGSRTRAHSARSGSRSVSIRHGATVGAVAVGRRIQHDAGVRAVRGAPRAR